jgi:hypothetical protein
MLESTTVAFGDVEVGITATFRREPFPRKDILWALILLNKRYPFVRIGLDARWRIVVRGEIPRYDQRRARDVEQAVQSCIEDSLAVIAGQRLPPLERNEDSEQYMEALRALHMAAAERAWRIAPETGEGAFDDVEYTIQPCIAVGPQKYAIFAHFDGSSIAFSIPSAIHITHFNPRARSKLALFILQYNASSRGGVRLALQRGWLGMQVRYPMADLHRTECMYAAERLWEQCESMFSQCASLRSQQHTIHEPHINTHTQERQS